MTSHRKLHALSSCKSIAAAAAIIAAAAPAAAAATAAAVIAALQEVKRFGGPMMISCTPVFGGAGVANQISELKRGTEVRCRLCL
jgi:hypothetical protein